MKKILVILALSATMAMSMSFSAAALTAIGEMAPGFTLTTLDGGTEISLSDLKGKVVYIDFWASWCGPCRRSLPEVQALAKEYKGRDVQVLGVNLDRKLEAGVKYAADQNLGFPSVFDDGGQVAQSYGVRSIPSMLIVGPDGEVAYSSVGFDPKALPDIKKVIEDLLGESQARNPSKRQSLGR